MGLKLNKSHIGQKFTRKGWGSNEWLKVLAFTSNGEDVFCEYCNGSPITFKSDSDCWLPYEEPKQKVLMNPALLYGASSGNIFITDQVYNAAEEAINDRPSSKLLSWPLKIVLKNVKTEQGFFERMEAEFYVEVEK